MLFHECAVRCGDFGECLEIGLQEWYPMRKNPVGGLSLKIVEEIPFKNSRRVDVFE